MALALFGFCAAATAQRFYVSPNPPSASTASLEAAVLEQMEETALQFRRAPSPAGIFQQLRFSPDGQYAFAQDVSGLNVLSVKPFALLFRASAESGSPATFTTDSHGVVFVSADASGAERLERWSLTDRTRRSASPIDLHSCATKALSPDGTLLACVESGGAFRLIDVATGKAELEKPNFAKKYTLGSLGFTCNDIKDALERATHSATQGAYQPVPQKDPKSFRCEYGDPGSAWIDFSSDGRFMLALPDFAEGTPILWDTSEKKQMKLSAALKELQAPLPQTVDVNVKGSPARRALITFERRFAFLGPDRIILQKETFREGALTPAEVVSVSSGKVIAKAQLPPGVWSKAADPAFVIAQPFGTGSALAVDYAAGSAITSKTSALDVMGNLYLAERSNGEIGLYERGKGILASVEIHKN